jgi:3-mercaptopyruvate sulfurtransferase SseA
MRLNILALLAFGLGIGLLAACASRDSAVSQTQRPSGQASSSQPSQSPVTAPADTAPRISVEELHKLYEKGEVLVIDTRSEIAFKESRIKGAILVPVADVSAKADELPRNKMIVTYCT